MDATAICAIDAADNAKKKHIERLDADNIFDHQACFKIIATHIENINFGAYMPLQAIQFRPAERLRYGYARTKNF